MQIFWLISLGCLTANAFKFEKNDSRINGENGWYVPLVDGSWKWLDKSMAESLLASKRFSEDPNNLVEFFLYTKSSPDDAAGEKITPSGGEIETSSFNPAHPTRFIIHGWFKTHLSTVINNIRNAWLSLGEHNIIVVDWHSARNIFYWNSVKAVPGVGEQVADMIDSLVEKRGMSLDTLHVVGHSLGAHIAGIAGKYTKTGKIHTIIGLDPALPLFSYNKPDKRLNSTDAFYVESIHTNGGVLGFKEPIGKASFYINGGEYQPSCILDITGYCSHSFALTYYAQAVTAFAAVKCENYNNAIAQNCSGHISSVRMSADANAYHAKGSYYVPIYQEIVRYFWCNEN